MNNKWLILINPIIALLLLSQIITSLNIFFPFLERKTFLTLHMYGGYLLAGFILIHLMLNWFWFNNVFFKKKKASAKAPAKPVAKAPAKASVVQEKS